MKTGGPMTTSGQCNSFPYKAAEVSVASGAWAAPAQNAKSRWRRVLHKKKKQQRQQHNAMRCPQNSKHNELQITF